MPLIVVYSANIYIYIYIYIYTYIHNKTEKFLVLELQNFKNEENHVCKNSFKYIYMFPANLSNI
jgi:hypothetical protein